MNSYSQVLQREIIPRNTGNKGSEGLLQGELQTAAQRNQRGHKQRCLIFKMRGGLLPLRELTGQEAAFVFHKGLKGKR